MSSNEPKSLVTVRRSAIHGRGLFAACDIPRGELIGTFEGSPTKRNGAYVLWVEDEDGVSYGIQGKNDIRFVNHSNEANADFDGVELYAVRNISEGDEITHDYGEDWD